MKDNLYKTEFFQNTIGYLSYTLTPDGIQPQAKNIEEGNLAEQKMEEGIQRKCKRASVATLVQAKQTGKEKRTSLATLRSKQRNGKDI